MTVFRQPGRDFFTRNAPNESRFMPLFVVGQVRPLGEIDDDAILPDGGMQAHTAGLAHTRRIG